MRQRLIITAALLHRPKILIVDEPIIGLDPKGTRLVRSLFKNLVKEGMTIFLSTHILGIAEGMCKRIGILQRGQMVALGSMDELSLRQQAKIEDMQLEALFLKLTGEDEKPNP